MENWRSESVTKMSSWHFTLAFILALLSAISTTAHITTCGQDFTFHTSKKKITNCKKLNSLGAEFGWEYNDESRTIDILFGAKLESEMGWLAWGVNPQDRPQMVGTRALIGIKQSNASLIINTYNITSDTKLGCRLLPTDIDVEVQHKSFYYLGKIQYYVINATLVLPSAYDISRLNIVWQVGHAVSGDQPMMHPTTLRNVDSVETLNLISGTSIGSVGEHRRHLRMVHGILNIIGWGTFMPVGVIVARYFRKFPKETKWWFTIHLFFQIGGYILGTSGWAIGLWLGNASKYYRFRVHRILAILIFTFTTLQMLALRLRPRPTDEYRKYWNMYHHFLGYALLALISVNIFQGIAILKPEHTWKWIYIGLLGVLGFITLAMEILTWYVFTKKNAAQPSQEKNTTPTNTSQVTAPKTTSGH